MKKSILISILILMMFLNLESEVSFDSDYHEYNNNHLLNYQFRYITNISKFNVNFNNKFQKANNKTFDQINSVNEFSTKIGTSYRGVRHGVMLNYKKLYDHYPQYHREGDITNNQYFTGYFVDVALTDSLITYGQVELAKSYEDNPNISDKDLINQGYIAKVNTNYGFNVLHNHFNLNLQYDNDNRTKNYKNQLNTVFSHNLDNDYVTFSNQITYQTSQDDIFTLVDNEYKQKDTQNRDNFRIISQVNNNFGERFYGYIESVIMKNNNRMAQTANKNNKDLGLDVLANFDYLLWDNVNVFVNNQYSFSTKQFSEKTNNRESDTKKVMFGVSVSNVLVDSLTVSQSMEIVATNFPEATKGFDNDFVREITRLSFRKQFYNTVNFDNTLTYSKLQEIYINTKYSGSNNIKTSYSYNPNVDILWGDNLLFSQLYSIRIDYDDFLYDSISNSDVTYTLYDRYYRQVSGEFKLRYDNSPVRSELNASVWKKPTGLIAMRDNVNLILSYKYFTNETGDKKSDIYEIKSNNKKHELYFQAEKNLGGINILLKPKAEWGNSESYEMNSVFTYNYSDETFVSLSAKPKYEVGKHELVYTVDTVIGVRF
ncbi:MAG: hypothetical protein WC155_01620 [Candidatus Cloacimonadales bacterium]